MPHCDAPAPFLFSRDAECCLLLLCGDLSVKEDENCVPVFF